MSLTYTNTRLQDFLDIDNIFVFKINIVLKHYMYYRFVTFLNSISNGGSTNFYFNLRVKDLFIETSDITYKVTDDEWAIIDMNKHVVIYPIPTDIIHPDNPNLQYSIYIENMLDRLINKGDDSLHSVLTTFIHDLLHHTFLLHTGKEVGEFKGLNAYAFLKFHRGN